VIKIRTLEAPDNINIHSIASVIRLKSNGAFHMTYSKNLNIPKFNIKYAIEVNKLADAYNISSFEIGERQHIIAINA
jgi:hypothetical protein